MKKGLYMLLFMILFMSVAISHVSAAEVQGKIKEGATSLQNTQVVIREQGNNNLIQTRTDGNGSFKAKLADGTYAIKAVKGKNDTWFSTNEQFVVKKGKIKGEIVLSEKKQSKTPTAQASNFTGVLKEENKGLKATLLLSNYSEYEEEFYTINTKGNGSFAASLPDGNYYLFGIQLDGGFYRHEQQFTVQDGKMVVNGEEQANLTITIPKNAYTGQVADSSTPLTNAHIIVEKKGASEEEGTEFIQEAITDKKGAFSLRALPDGVYTLSVSHDTYSVWNDQTFEVIDGAIYIDGIQTDSFRITVPEITLNGTLYDGDQPISTNAYISFGGENASGEYNDYWMPVDSSGNFQYRLEDGSYTITYISEQNRDNAVNISFELQDGKLYQSGEIISNLKITLPPVTFSGKLVDGGQALQGAVNVEQISEESYEWYHAQTDENGVYSLRLPDGSYQVTGGYLYDEGEELSLFLPFEIVDGKLVVNGQEQEQLDVQIPPVSVHGLVKDGTQVVTSGYVSILSEDHGGYSFKQINEDGSFSLRLADGNYQLMEVQLEDGTTANVNQAFTVQDGQTYVDGQLQERLEIIVPPVTVTGTLTESGNPVMGSVYIMEMYDAEDPLQAHTSSDEQGYFQLRLPDGEYKVYDIYPWDGPAFHSGAEFKIADGQLYINGEKAEQLNIALDPVTVTGTVTNGEELVYEGFVSIASLDGNWSAGYPGWIQGGNYQMRLPDGEYQITMVQDFYSGDYYFNKPFTLNDGRIFVDGEEVSTLDLNLQDGVQETFPEDNWEEPVEGEA
ncbi:MAG: carboxypeptidase-like regulatory domain-containing protein [Bacillota bacterium]